jgi:hypothetical protein
MQSSATTIGHVIQLAVAPVFLLTGIGAFVGVLTSRLGRIIDRRRVLDDIVPYPDKATERVMSVEFSILVRRGHFINRAIGLCTMSALLVCIVVVALFVGAFLKVDMFMPIGILFIGTMLTLVGGLVYFLREIRLAMIIARAGASDRDRGSEAQQARVGGLQRW